MVELMNNCTRNYKNVYNDIIFIFNNILVLVLKKLVEC